MPDELRHRVRRQTVFTGRRSPSSGAETYRRSRNVSEPLPTPSANYTRESCSTNLAYAHTVGDIANLSSDDISTAIHSSQSVADLHDTTGFRSFENNDRQRRLRTIHEDSRDTSGHIQVNESRSEQASVYSTDSADLDAHAHLLSMSIIPQIRLERKATVRKPEPPPLSDGAQNRAFLSPRIADLRTPARMSSRRYGRILTGSSAPAVVCNAAAAKRCDHGTLQGPHQSGSTDRDDHAEDCATVPAHKRSLSEPTFNPPYALGDEREPLLKKEIDDSPHSDVLLSMIDEVGSSAGPRSNGVESGIDEALKLEQAFPKHAQRSHQRSSANIPVPLGSTVHIVAGESASVDPLPKPKPKPKSPSERKPVPNAHDPTFKWAPKHGQIIIKVFVASTDDIWMFRVPQDINLADFTSKVVAKLGFVVSFSGSVWDEPKYHFRTDERFKAWIKGRIRFGRNLPIVAHVLAPLPLVKLSVDADGCEVWCYA